MDRCTGQLPGETVRTHDVFIICEFKPSFSELRKSLRNVLFAFEMRKMCKRGGKRKARERWSERGRQGGREAGTRKSAGQKAGETHRAAAV